MTDALHIPCKSSNAALCFSGLRRPSLSARRAKHSLRRWRPGPHPSCCEDRPACKPFTTHVASSAQSARSHRKFNLVESSNNSNDCLKSGGLCFPKLRPIQYESPAKRRRQIKEYNAGICQRDITWILRNFYQVMPGMRWGGSFKHRTWLSETLCL